jgi:hypothetical protein
MKRIIAALIILILLLLCSCTPEDKPFSPAIHLDSRVFFNLAVPLNTDISFQLVWYRIRSKITDDLEDAQWTVGNEAELQGENTDQMDGATVTVTRRNLQDLVDESYYQTILMEENYVYGTHQLNDEKQRPVMPSHAAIQLAQQLLKNYIENGEVLIFSLSFDGFISCEVNVDRIEIKAIQYTVLFDHFKIAPAARQPSSMIIPDRIFHPAASGSILVGPSLSKCGYCFIEGEALQDIKEIRILSLNDACTIVSRDNYLEYERLCETKFDITQKMTDFQADSPISIECDYVMNNDGETPIKMFDVAVASLATEFILPNDQQVYSYLYQTSMRAPEYALVHVLHDLR